MSTVLITGGTGLVGQALGHALLEKGYNVTILSRQAKSTLPDDPFRYAAWDVERGIIDEKALQEADYIIHLAGAGVAEKRWTSRQKKLIIDSRVNSSRLIAESLQKVSHKVKAVIAASAIGWYGPDPAIPNPHPFSEEAAPANDFLGAVCHAWEKSIEPVAATGVRLVKVRIGIVLSSNGGALKEFRKPMRFGVAAILGRGSQVMSWIHIDDLVRMFIHATENEQMRGVYNAVAPNPVSNREITIGLAKARKKFFIPFHVPSFLLRMMLGEMSVEILKSATVSATKISKAGFTFSYPDISKALENLAEHD